MTESADNSENPPPVVHVGRLNRLSKVRRELARLYADLRNGRVTPRVAGCGAYILTAITKTLEVEAIENRIAALEERAAGMPPAQTRQAGYARQH